ncbi:DNA polymerase III subunit gamma/tau [Oceanicoccus sagamiensis]|uniref:DNA polymerase III subunit gamma/tau n=1 Tax=Oceanicoccus sagamiensis TaxID=716816 RepID=A0A1X9NEA4_9GAMM|nr:DNA polymerase III subunit gamma/tau [Oceanicoccus sagamiensis]ARN75886.1 DNA polymerase III subunit gamma/tau [Oceanicoccus sagamiensis]
MSYQVLARKWRPKTFREMVGQEHVLKALINALDHNRLHHAYLFTGTRGVGKTTIARILAKCLNCEVGVSSEPCGQCSACNSINEGRFVDLIEVDAASRTKVEDTRELLENVQYAPTVGRYKVYLIDEVHMLSTHSFNALLKTLEEPPPHVKFLLATTDPQKLPATILSRCLQFNLKNMSPERIVGHLQHVLEQEMVSFDEAALWLLGRSADGSMRDAMSLADQAISFGSGKLLEPDVRNMLGTIDQTAVYDIIDALATADGAQVLAAVSQLSEHAPDYIAALEELLTLLHRIAITQAVPDATDNSFGDRERVTELAGRIAAEDVQLFYQMALNGRRDLPLSPDPRSGFEMVLLRMLAFKPAGIAVLPQASVQNTQSAASAEAPQPVKKPEPVATPPAVAERPGVKELAGQPVAAQLESVAEPIPEPIPEPLITPEPAQAPKPVVVAVPEPEPVAPPPLEQPESTLPPATETITLSQLTPSSWNQLFERLGFGGVVGNIASHCVLKQVDGDKLVLDLDEGNATLFSDSYTARIQEHLSVTLNAPIKLTINVKPVEVETPSGRKLRLIKERRQQALVDLQNDPNVQTLINDFAAVLVEDSVEPV